MFGRKKKMPYLCAAFLESALEKTIYMVAVVQLVRASDCGSECRGFESHLPPQRKKKRSNTMPRFFLSPLLVFGNLSSQSGKDVPLPTKKNCSFLAFL